MLNIAIVRDEKLSNINTAAKVTGMSRTYLFKLPDGTPGKYRFGRAVRFNIRELKAWARRAANETKQDDGNDAV